MRDGPTARVARELGPGVLERLVSLDAGDLQSLLLEVVGRRAGHVTPRRLLEQYGVNRFVRPSGTPARALTAFEDLAWSLLPDGYEALELSPLCPLGTNSAVATVSQNKVVATVRNAEVVADTTNVLALEAALRRRALLSSPETATSPVRLAASQRQVRAQRYGDPSSLAHFRLLGLVAAGRREQAGAFECAAVVEQIAYVVTLVSQLRVDLRVEIVVTDFSARSRMLNDKVRSPLVARFGEARVRTDDDRTDGQGYYRGICYKLRATDAAGREFEFADGGRVDWTARLLSDEKEQLVIGGVGVERLLS